MKHFFYEDKFYHDLGDLIDEWGEDEVKNFPDDWSITVEEATEEPILTLSTEWIIERIDDERWTEDGDEWHKVHKVLVDNIDFQKINTLMPKLWYETRKKVTITKADLLDYMK